LTTIDSKLDIDDKNNRQELILSLTSNEEIIQFNKECEQFTGYQRDEVIHKKLSEILLPKESLEQWKAYFDSIRRTLSVDSFILPIKTKHDQTYLVSWNAIIIKDTNGSIKDICLFGKPQKTDEPMQLSQHIPTTPASVKKENVPYTEPSSLQEAPTKVICLKHDRKKILFASEKEKKNEAVDMSLQETLSKPFKKIEKNKENASEILDLIHKSLKELAKKYDLVLKRLEDLEKKDQRLEKNDRYLGKHVQPLEEDTRRFTKKEKETNQDDMLYTKHDLQNNKHTFFSDLFGFKRQHQELNAREQEIKIKASQLNAIEKQLMKEQKTFNTQVEEFCRWREKLELLETAIEKRRQELIEQEEASLNNLPVSTSVPAQLDKAVITPSVAPDSYEVFDEIPQSAAIIQRGILKKINTSFASLLGYTSDEMVEKSFFDLIAQDGLADIERYYLDRLKGEDVTVYKTVFSTKDNNKIAVEVNIKQTIYNGEKAEIVIVKKLD
jgi:PAS domain S-box-containing protein